MIPVKGAPAAKSRLGPAVPDDARAVLARAFALDTIAAALARGIGRSRHRGGRRPLARGRGRVRRRAACDGAERSARCRAIAHGIAPRSGRARAARRRVGRVAVLLGDLPALRPEELDAALAAAARHPLAFVRDADGAGTTLATASPERAVRAAVRPRLGRAACRCGVRRARGIRPARPHARRRHGRRPRNRAAPWSRRPHRRSRGQARRSKGNIMTLTLGYKASAEQFAPRELVEIAVAAEGHGMESVWTSDHFQPWRHDGRARAVLAHLDGRGRRAHVDDPDRHERDDADVPLQPRRARPGVREPRMPLPGSRHRGLRHGRGAQRDRHRIPRSGRAGLARVPRAVRATARVGAAHARALERRPGELRGRVLLDARRVDLRRARRRRAGLHRRRRADGREVRGPRGRRLHLHVGQGRRALRRPAHPGGEGGRRGSRAIVRRRSTA